MKTDFETHRANKMASLKNLTIFIAFGLLMIVCVSRADDSDAAESKDNIEDDENTIKVYKRLIPADVLRGKLDSHISFRNHCNWNWLIRCMHWQSACVSFYWKLSAPHSHFEFRWSCDWIVIEWEKQSQITNYVGTRLAHLYPLDVPVLVFPVNAIVNLIFHKLIGHIKHTHGQMNSARHTLHWILCF